MYQLLFVEDHEDFRFVTADSLSSPEIEIAMADSLGAANQLLNSKNYDLVLLDLDLPDGNGLDFLNKIKTKNETREIPVVLLSSKTDIESKLSAFSLGADDFVSKTTNPIEVKARVNMLLKKSKIKKQTPKTLKKGSIILDMELMRASIASDSTTKTLDLTAKEFKILSFLMRNEDAIVSRSSLIQAVWENTHVLERTIDTHVCGLRRKLGKFSGHIESITGIGYRFNINLEKELAG